MNIVPQIDVQPRRSERPVVQGRDHLSASRQGVRRQQRRRHRRFRRSDRRLDYLQDLGVTTLWLLPFYPSPGKDDGYDIADYRRINPDFGTMRDFRRFMTRGAAARSCASSPSWSSTTPPTSIRGSSARGAAGPAPTRATGTSGATPTRNTTARASSSPTPRSRTGPGTRRPRRITGTASSRTSPTSTSTIRACSGP